MEDEIKIDKNTQKFIGEVSKFSNEQHHKVIAFLDKLKIQQDAEANLESKKGWRYMWQRTPKPYLLMLGYLVFFGSVGSFGWNAFQHAENQTIFLIIFGLLMIFPLAIVSYLSYQYVKHLKDNKEKDDEAF